MPKNQLTPDSEFIVKEEKILGFILSGLFFAIFLYGIVYIVIHHFKDYADYLYVLALLPALFFFKKAKSKRIYIRINKAGIYHDEKLVTNWATFLHAYVSQKENKSMRPTIQDNFVLVVEYKKEGKGFRRQIPLTNTQNKSEEEVLNAVKYFSNVGKK